MGRAKIAMEFITKEKVRNVTYAKRKKGLLKKGREFAILCNVPVCIIMYPYKEGKQPYEPEVYSFKGNNKADLGRVKDPDLAREIIERYLAVPKEERVKRSLNLTDMFDEWIRKADHELDKLRLKNAMAKYPNMSTWINNFTPNQLMEMLVYLDQKIECVNLRIDMINGNKSGLVTVIEPATPVSSFIIPSDNNANQAEYHNQFCEIIDNGEVINQFPNMYNNYPMFSNNILDSHQIGHFNPDLDTYKRGQIGQGHDTGGINNNAVLYNFNMNMTYCDQGSSMDDVSAMPVSMPLSLPLMSNFSMSGQCHKMFYD
ncbi:hypothetical protein RND81_09G060700 [Saponaria officinalis]|uniref:MADS-box domain-containing protein n=1 Tax=Saponaria officinalis TaxID=3572 RepID=A0AAW1IIM2_SAPOF